MKKHFFRFKDQRSDEMGIIITKIPPITKPAARIIDIKIPGRNGMLHENEGTYENYTKEVECAIKNRSKNIPLLATRIGKWLDGGGDLIFSSEPDVVYKATVKNAIAITDVLNSFSKFLLQFDVFPFKYSTSAFGDDITLTAPQTIYNKGTVYSEPLITVYGNGGITLTINGKAYRFVVDGWITIDSEQMEVYKGAESRNNAYQSMEFPRFEVGANRIEWTGDVEKIEIRPRWRWL